MPVGIAQKENVDTIVQKVWLLYKIFDWKSSIILYINLRHVANKLFPFSFFQRILQSWCSIMMAKWMAGGILNGVAGLYILLHRTKQSGETNHY